MPYYLYIHNIYLYQCHDTKPNSINIDWLLGLTPTITKYCTTIRENICYGIHHTRVPVGHYHLKHITIWFKKFKQHLQSPSKVILLLRCHKCKTNRICQIGWGHSNYFKQWHPIQIGFVRGIHYQNSRKIVKQLYRCWMSPKNVLNNLTFLFFLLSNKHINSLPTLRLEIASPSSHPFLPFWIYDVHCRLAWYLS